jgi:hypothetical protein
MSGERLHHLWQANAAPNNPMQKTGTGDSYPGDEALPASDLERWVEWNHGILQLVPVTWKHLVLPDRTDLSFQLRSPHLRA